ncbi:MAG: Ig domain-containing protein, partial [Vicinamibacterales bacterium]
MPTSTGSYSFVVHVQDFAGHTYARTFALTVASASGLVVGATNPSDTWIGSGRSSQTLFAQPLNGGPSIYNWSVAGGALPPGMTLQQDGAGTTQLVGQPTAGGAFVYTLRATNAANPSDAADRVFTAHVSPFQVVSPPLAFMSAPDLPSAHVGVPYSTTIKLAGGTPPYSFGVAPLSVLPPGLAVSATGTLSGTPTGIGSFTLVLAIADATGATLRQNFALVVTPPGIPAPLLSVDSLAPQSGDDGGGLKFGAPFLFALDGLVRGGVAPFAWSLAPGSSAPPGLSILGGGDTAAYAAGIPTAFVSGFTFGLRVTDAAGQTLTIPEGLSVIDLGFNRATIPPGVVGASYSQSLMPSGGLPPYTVQLGNGSDLPVGLALSSSGVLSGTPHSAGNFILGVQLTDRNGTGTGQAYNLTIDNAAGEAQAISLSPSPVAIYYELGSASPPATPVAVNATSGTLPFTIGVAGAPWASLGASAGQAPSPVDLGVDVGSLSVGTYFGLITSRAPDSVSRD